MKSSLLAKHRPPISESKVLIVDDNGVSLTLLKHSLEKLGCERITPVRNAEEALIELNKQQFDLVITDWCMPKMSGLDLLKHIRADRTHRETPVLMLTGEDSRQGILEAIQAGATSYIVKPFSLETLKKKIEILAG